MKTSFKLKLLKTSFKLLKLLKSVTFFGLKMNALSLNFPVYMRLRNIINMSNGVIGISVLTMPYCFEQVR